MESKVRGDQSADHSRQFVIASGYKCARQQRERKDEAEYDSFPRPNADHWSAKYYEDEEDQKSRETVLMGPKVMERQVKSASSVLARFCQCGC